MSEHTLVRASGARTPLELTNAQLAAIDAWNAARRSSEADADATTMTREMRLDLSHRTQARRREQQAVLARAEQQLRESGELRAGAGRTRAVLAHRNAWLREGVATQLTSRGVAVVGAFEDGAEAAGTIVVEQPDLVLVEDRLPTLSGVEVVRRVRTFAPDAVIGAQCLDGDGVAPLLEAGAQAVFTRRISPQQIADELYACFVNGGVPVAAR